MHLHDQVHTINNTGNIKLPCCILFFVLNYLIVTPIRVYSLNYTYKISIVDFPYISSLKCSLLIQQRLFFDRKITFVH